VLESIRSSSLDDLAQWPSNSQKAVLHLCDAQVLEAGQRDTCIEQAGVLVSPRMSSRLGTSFAQYKVICRKHVSLACMHLSREPAPHLSPQSINKKYRRQASLKIVLSS